MMMNKIPEDVCCYAVSACLLGENCKYSGGNNFNDNVLDFLRDKEYIAICPEILGGLSTPRAPSEIIQSHDGIHVINNQGADVTKSFEEGADHALRIIKENGIEIAILKANSPSCGFGSIYDGTFSGRLIKGNGITTQLLLNNGITVISDDKLQ